MLEKLWTIAYIQGRNQHNAYINTAFRATVC